MKKLLVPLAIAWLTLAMIFSGCSTGEIAVFKVLENGGDDANLEKITEKVKDADIILFGELHNNALAHWLELRLTKELHKMNADNLVVGAEMFEADTQIMIDEYFAGLYPTKNFEDEAKVWKNYQTDYKPILEFAKKNKLKFVATNVPRRYAAFVARKGLKELASLGADAQKLFAPLPVTYIDTLPAYKEMSKMPTHSKEVKFIAEAQAIKDATMAHFILKNWAPGKKFVHFHGAYHSDNYQGITWYLKHYNPNLKIVTITTVEAETADSLSKEDKTKADYIIVIPDDMTKTY
jgi:uncharacterized iron-regulated protein